MYKDCVMRKIAEVMRKTAKVMRKIAELSARLRRKCIFKVHFSEVFLSKVYFCKMYPTRVSSKLCEFIEDETLMGFINR